ncbi:MAG: valine--tRNA ligase [Rubripirellula sp.]
MNADTKTDSPEATSIPDRFDHAVAAGEVSKAWDEAKCWHAEVNPDRPSFSMVIPPPNVTGALHLGHGLNNTLQDIVTRKKRMQGFEALWMPGTDHAGIATQAVVERRLKELENKTRHDIGREALVQRIWDWKDQYEKRILEQLKRMGCSCDWDRLRFTLDDRCAAAVRSTFYNLFSEKLIYRGKRLVNWDTHLQTAVSNDEVNNETKKGHFWHFSYPVIAPKPGEPTHVEIATTRPETMLGDTAVAVHPNPEKALDKVEADLREKLAEASDKEKPDLEMQLEKLSERRASMLPQLIMLRDMAADGRKLMLPLVNREIPLVADRWAKPELGSGCVKITPAHDPNDYEVGKRLDLPMLNILNSDGTLNAEAGKYEGLTIPTARKQVVADLESLDLLGEVEDREIELPMSDRSKTPVEPYLADQWFVAMDSLAQNAMDLVSDGSVKIYPERYRKGYLDWLGEKRDWPVSRQLWWGHRIPVWSKTDLTKSEADAEVEKVEAIIGKAKDMLAYRVDETEEGTFHIFVCIHTKDEIERQQQLEAAGFEQDPDVLDTWFSSALWPHSTLGWPEASEELDYFYPTSTLITSRDIITLWVARMVLMSWNNLGAIPFQEVFIHPKILDGNGVTMSKSRGNGVDPIDVIDKFGPDAMRFGLARMATDTQDVRMPVQYECPHCNELINQTKKNQSAKTVVCSKCDGTFSTQWAESDEDKAHPKGAVVSERFETARNFVNKLWNAARFSLMNMDGYSPQQIDVEKLPVEDRWLLSRLATVTKEVTDCIDRYRFAEASRILYDFAWDEFCSFYVEIAKPRLNDPEKRAMTQSVIAHGLDTLLKLLHPTMPFVTESIWTHLNEAAPQRGITPTESVQFLMRAPWPEADESHHVESIERQFEEFQQVVSAIRKIRASQNIPPRESVPVAIRCSQSSVDLLGPMKDYFAGLCGAAISEIGPDVKPFETDAPLALAGIDIDVHVDLEKFIDLDAEVARLEKLDAQLTKQIAGKQSKLGNENFVARAPADVVEQERKALTELCKQKQSVEQDIERLRKKILTLGT